MDVVKRAKAQFTNDKEHWEKIFLKARDDLYFLSDEENAQWDEKSVTVRRKSGLPTITIDQLSQFVHQVVNDVRMNTPTIRISPHGGGADIETADIISGLIKDIEYNSCADEAYDAALDFSVKSSIGFIRIDHDYDGEGFDQALCIRRVINPLCVFLDYRSIESDGSDAKHAFVLEDIPVEKFKKEYPKFDPIPFSDNVDEKKTTDESTVTIAEYFVIEENQVEIGIINGQVEEVREGVEYEQTRMIERRTVKRYKLSGADILEETTFPGEYIPLIPVYGEEAWEDGERKLLSLIRKSKEAQRMFNYWKSVETQILMKSPKSPIIAAVGQTEDFMEDYQNPDKAMVLRYNPVEVNGQFMPPPNPLPMPQLPVGIVNAARASVDDIKASMGMYNAAIGQRSNESSGVAINARKVEGEVAVFHFGDNLARSITQVGRVLVSALPAIYDTPRTVRVIDPEGNNDLVGINGARVDGQEQDYYLTNGKYSVRVELGPSFTTQRQEAAQFYTDIFTKQPQLMEIAGDLLFKYMDMPGAQALSDRLKRVIPPNVLGENESEQDPEKMQLTQALEQSKQVILKLTQEMETLQEDVSTKQAELQLKAQSEAASVEQDQVKNELEVLKLQLEEKKVMLEAEVKREELALKRTELELKQQEVQLSFIEAAKEPATPPPIAGNQAAYYQGD